MDRIITGLHGIEESLRAGKSRGRLFISRKNARIDSICAEAGKSGVDLVNIPPSEMNRRFGENRGIVLQLFESGANKGRSGKPPAGSSAEVSSAEEATGFEEMVDALTGENPLVLILDGVTDPHNFGAILRSADQFGVDLVVTRSRRSASESDTVARTSSGAVNFVPAVVVSNLVRAVEYLKKHGFWIYSADMGGEPVYKLNLKGRTALVMGSEGKGVSRLLSEKCDETASIPSTGNVDSFNVSVATGILLYEIRRQQADG